MTSTIVRRLLGSDEPSVRFKVLTQIMGRKANTSEVRQVQEEIRESPRVRQLLSERQADGQIPCHPYSKWNGAHWVLATLADLGYPSVDESLIPLREQVLGWLLGEGHLKGIKTIAGRVRRCASQEGNALYALLTLGLTDERTEELARRLTQWQWPDGGWNCDKKPAATNSSFMESLLPLRALALHARLTGNQRSREAAERAADVFLKRELFKRQHDGSVIHEEFITLHYPCYWHYDILFGLKVMAEAGWLGDERCQAALDVLETKRLADGGFPAEKKYYQNNPNAQTGRSLVDWGGTSRTQMNEFVTVEALAVLKAAKRDGNKSG
ncbi:MAG TPA: hypothetical protein VJM08_07940 [Anaerolineales bacterium]|nr:hypothetical protein [Anaerolineales bacterium]